MTIQSLQASDSYFVPAYNEEQRSDIITTDNTQNNSSKVNFSGLQKELSQILSNVQPPQSIKETAQRQLANGKIDIKV